MRVQVLSASSSYWFLKASLPTELQHKGLAFSQLSIFMSQGKRVLFWEAHQTCSSSPGLIEEAPPPSSFSLCVPTASCLHLDLALTSSYLWEILVRAPCPTSVFLTTLKRSATHACRVILLPHHHLNTWYLNLVLSLVPKSCPTLILTLLQSGSLSLPLVRRKTWGLQMGKITDNCRQWEETPPPCAMRPGVTLQPGWWLGHNPSLPHRSRPDPALVKQLKEDDTVNSFLAV